MSQNRPLLVVGTHNAKKGKELTELLLPYGIDVKTLADFPDAIDVVEDGDTFAANAQLKAVGQAKHLNQWVLADDSGIQVHALKGRPGIYSARYAGPECDDEANNRLLLEELAGKPPAQRTANYYCHITLAEPSGTIAAEASGKCTGRIVETPRGTNGFGYDPLFELREYHRTFGELGPEVKRVISHRSRAIRGILPGLLRTLASTHQ